VAVSTALDAVRLGSSEVAALYLGSDSVWTANAPGMVLVSPTSIAYSGTSATLGANGQVTFTAVTSVSLNGCFTAGFDNYVVSVRLSMSSNDNIRLRYRVSGSDATGTDYTRQYLAVNNTSVSAGRLSSSTEANITYASSANRNGTEVFLYGPYLAQPTASRSITVGGFSGAFMQDEATTHSLSTSYDGFTLFPNTVGPTMTGALQVYGVRS
jgi:hypothetical protein